MKKVLSLLVAVLLMAAAMLSGCAETPAEPPVSDPSAPVSQASEPAGSEAGEEPVNLIFYNFGAPSAGNQKVFDAINEKLLAEYNCTVEFNFIDWADMATRYPLLFAAGEECDAIFTANWMNYGDYAKKGGLMELTPEMLETYAPLSMQNISESQWAQSKVDGKIYMVPMSDLAINDLVYLVRGDLREKYGLGEITDTESLIEYWDAVVANEPEMYAMAQGGIGSTDDAGAWIFATFNTFPAEYFSDNYAVSWLHSPIYTSIDMSDPNNITTTDDREYFIETYEMMKGFQEKGYWSKNALNQADASTTMFENGKSASCVHPLDSLNSLYLKIMENNPEWKPEIVDIRFSTMPVAANPSTNNGCSISMHSKNPEKTLQVIDLFSFDREYYDLVHYGIKGVHWDSEDDTSVTMLTPSDSDLYAAYGMPFTSNMKRQYTLTAPNYGEFKELFGSHVYTPLTGLMTFDNSSVQAEEAALNNVNAKYRYILQLGFAEDVEQTVNDFYAELEAAGLAKYQEAYLAQLKEFLATYSS